MRIRLIFTFILLSNLSFSQAFENAWINYNQQYYRLSISKNGIYRVYESELTAAGIPVSSFNPQNIQIFYKGQEQAIFVKDNFGLLQYIEFYAEKNDGWFDTALYKNPGEQTNPYYSLINDTASYYFTWNSSFQNKRLRTTNYTDFENYETLAYCIKDTMVQYTSGFYDGETDPQYTSGEGWFDNRNSALSIGSSITKSIKTPGFVSNLMDAKIQIAMVGYSSANHHLAIDVNNTQLSEEIYTGLTSLKTNFEVSSNILTNPLNIVFNSIDDQGANTDYSVVSYIDIQYARNFNFSDYSAIEISLPEITDTLNYIEFSGIDDSNPVIIYNLNANTRTKSTLNNDIHQAIIPSESNQKILLVNEEGTLSVEHISKIQFTNYSQTSLNQSYIIITERSLWDEALQYAAFRDAYLVDINQLYHQFAYGIIKHPLAITNFLNYVYSNSSEKPEYLLLLGKGILMQNIRKSVSNYENCLIPAMGNPPSDNLYTAGMFGTNFEPLIATGRISATGNAEVRYYLDKVKEYDITEPGEWNKQFLHFGGGLSTSEQQSLANYLKTFENIIEDTLYGGFVSTFLKSSSEPIQITISDTIKNLINNGVSMLTFFGHAAASGFDQNIDDPSAYDNKGKYPFLLANSCYSGNIFNTNTDGVSERWVLIEDKGVIGFLASTYLGYAYELSLYSTELYKNFAYKNYGKSIGKCIQQAVKDYVGTNFDNSTVKNTALQFVLHGDPAVSLHSLPKPDIVISQSSVFTKPHDISTEIDSFNLNVVLTNIGKTVSDTFAVNVTRTFPDGSSKQYIHFVPKNFYKDTLNFNIEINRLKGIGSNKLTIFVDANQTVDEYNELNNRYETNIFIKSNDLYPVYPYKLAMIPTDSVTLLVSTGDPFVKQQQSVFQMDNTLKFNSSNLIQQIITHDGGVVSWPIPKQLNAGETYFWRASKKPVDGNYYWNTSSFTYKPGKTGWAQSGFQQMSENNFSYIEYNELSGKYEFIFTPKQLHCHNIGNATHDSQYTRIEYTIDGEGDASACGVDNYLNVVIIDSLTNIPWESDRADYGHTDYPKCSNRIRPDRYFLYQANNPSSLDNMVTFLEDSVPNGNYILIYNFRFTHFSEWSDNVFNTFESLGSNEIRNVPDSFPYIFFTQKGYPSVTQEVKGETFYQEIDLYAELANNYFSGEISSPLIGPAKTWNNISWQQHSNEQPNTDSVRLTILGIRNTGVVNKLQELSSNQGSYNLNSIDAKTYPYLQLKFFTQDEINKTPSQIDNWQVEYDIASELAIDPSSYFSFQSDSVNEGEPVNFSVAVNNISPVASDSTIIKYWLYDQNLNYVELDSNHLAPIEANSAYIDSITFSSLYLPNHNQLWMEVNPLSSENFAMEQYHFNNLLSKDFDVIPDQENPILDVTFDGRHIMNNDIVSSKPEILITLKDENKYLAMNDTALFSIFVTSATHGTQPVYFEPSNTESHLQWIPGSLPENKFKIIYTPVFTEDGIYELSVQAKDNTGNYSGDDYRINFEIVTKSTITNIYNYPNPFSTATHFVFELTGSEIPDDFRIQIFTISGKLVHEINLAELETIRIGKNITSYAWDGKDMYGDRLANGVYFYRVFVNLKGSEIEKRQTSADSFFKNDWGKMYLIR